MATAPSTTVVIVTYRSLATIDRALEAARVGHEAGELHCVVVDNASGDGTLEHVRENYEFVQAIDSGANLGFGRGCNVGAEVATTPYTLFLNPDATLSVEALRTLVGFMDDRPEVGICTPHLDQQAVGLLTRPLDVVRAPVGFSTHSESVVPNAGDAPFRTNWVCGAALMIRTELFRRLGGFDPRFFLYFEETDLCVRAAESGAELWCVPTAVASHFGAVSTKQADDSMVDGCIAEHYFQSRFYFMQKHYGRAVALAADSVELVEIALVAGMRALRGRDDPGAGLRARLKGTVLRPPRVRT